MLDVQLEFLPSYVLSHAQRSACMQGSSKQNDSVADVVLTGHTDIAEFAEGISNAAPLVASGGRDTNVSNYPAPGASLHGVPRLQATVKRHVPLCRYSYGIWVTMSRR